VTVLQVPLLDLRRNTEQVDAELEAAFLRVLKSGHYILGPEVDAFERECAQHLGVKHAIGVSSGTDALLLALMALGVGPGDQVICPAYTFFATAGTISRVGAKPVFADITPCCYNVAISGITARVTAKTRAIIPVHLYGQSADMDPLLEMSKTMGIPVVEDAAQAIGARYRGRGAGTRGDYGCYSFFPSKNVGALGDAGLLVTNDDALAERARIMRAHGGKPKYYHQVVGGNFRIDALQAALLRVKLKRLDESTRRRNTNAALYTALLQASGLAGPTAVQTCCGAKVRGVSAGKKVLLPVVCQESHIYNQYVIRLPGEGTRDKLRTFLGERKVGTEIYYPVPMHLQACFASLGGVPGDHPESEAAARETLALPIFPELREEEVKYVVDQVVEFFA
jgi:dTDP-4-amino-4,6-dideoxygalactose transaminase